MKKLEPYHILDVYTHDVKSPVVSIQAIVAILKNLAPGEFKKEVDVYLLRIEEKTNKINQTINLVTDLVFLQAKKLQLDPEFFDLDKMIDVVLLEIKKENKKHSFVKEGKQSLEIFADKERIAQVVRLLIYRSIFHARPRTEIRIKINTEKKGIHLSFSFQKRFIEKTEKERFSKKQKLEDLFIKEILKLHKGKVFLTYSFIV